MLQRINVAETWNPEGQYLDLLQRVLDHGDHRIDRTGVGTLAVFGAFARFDLSSGKMPILTTKRVSWKTAVKEMLWFLTGSTRLRPLLQQNVRIWTDWPLSRYQRASGEKISQSEFEDRILGDDKFDETWGDLGPVYGKQWRRWETEDGREIDQIAAVVDLLKNNPSSRRILFHAWNLADLDKMTLPPCHFSYQYFVSGNRLSCLMYQRSVDLLLGAPFNFVGTVALQMMIADQAGLELGEFIWTGGDVHLYSNHIDQAKEQLQRKPRELPEMRLKRHAQSIDDYKIEDFEVVGYDPYPAIVADIAV